MKIRVGGRLYMRRHGLWVVNGPPSGQSLSLAMLGLALQAGVAAQARPTTSGRAGLGTIPIVLGRVRVGLFWAMLQAARLTQLIWPTII